MRTWVIPDVHGCLLTLRMLVEDLIELRKDDSLIFLGDIIDRGPSSKGVIDYIIKLKDGGINVKVLKGNHEEYMAKVFRNEQSKKGIRRMLGLKSANFKDWML